MTKRTLSHIAAIFILFATLFSQSGCRENTIINTNITPAGDSLIVEGESVELIAKTVYSPFITNTYFTGLKVIMGLGRINNDPEIGMTNASFYMQVVPKQSAGYTLPANIDSVVVVLPYAGFTYGDTAGTSPVPQQYKVYRINDAFPRDSQYYNFSYKNFDTELGSTSAPVALQTIQDSVTVGDVSGKVLPHLRIPLDSAVVNPMLRNANYNSYADFLTSFNGLYIRALDNGGNNVIPYFRLNDNGAGNSYARAGIVVYYHDVDSPSVAKSDAFGFNPDNCAFFNKFDYDISGSNAAMDTAQYLYLQSRPGLSIELTTKDVKNLPNRLVNKAEIVITETTPQPQTYFEPEYLYPYVPGVNGNGIDSLMLITGASYTSPTGGSVSGLGFINGKATKVTINGNTYNQYIVNVPREFQKALIEKREMTLRITGVTNGYIGAFRLKAGKNHPTNSAFNIRMNVVYSGIQ